MARVLIADDDDLIVGIVRQTLIERGFDTLLAYNGNEALSLVASETPDIIVLDGNMPDMDGFEVLKSLKANQNTKHIPVIMLTARKNKQDVIQGVSAGIVDYIIKPFSPDDLVSRISTALAKTPAVPEKPAAKPKSAAPQTEEASNSNEMLNVLFVDAFEANHFTLHSTFKKYPEFNVDTVSVEGERLPSLLPIHTYHVVVIDCSQPQCDGYRLAMNIRQMDKEKNHYRVILGLGDEAKNATGKRWLMAGMNDYFQKPIAIKTMVDILKRFRQVAMERYI